MKKYVLRGGVIALSVGLILGLILYSVAFSAHDISDAYGPYAEKVFDFIATALLITPLSAEGFSFVESVPISAVYIFLIGALIGWLYGKYKYKYKDL